MHKPESTRGSENETHKILWDSEIQTDHLIPAKRPELVIINQKKSHIVNFAVLVDHRVKIKESEKIIKYLDLTWELRKLQSINPMVIKIVMGTLGTVPKDLEKGLEELEIGGRIEIIQITALLRSARILRRIL